MADWSLLHYTECTTVQAPLFVSSVVSWLPGLAYDALEQHYRLGPRCGHAAVMRTPHWV